MLYTVAFAGESNVVLNIKHLSYRIKSVWYAPPPYHRKGFHRGCAFQMGHCDLGLIVDQTTGSMAHLDAFQRGG